MQVCPDCHRQWSDDTNYCGKCRAKLPNAKEWVVDYKKMWESPGTDAKKIAKTVHERLADEKFRSRLFFLLLACACDGTNSPSVCENYLREEILALVLQEMFREERS